MPLGEKEKKASAQFQDSEFSLIMKVFEAPTPSPAQVGLRSWRSIRKLCSRAEPESCNRQTTQGVGRGEGNEEVPQEKES